MVGLRQAASLQLPVHDNVLGLPICQQNFAPIELVPENQDRSPDCPDLRLKHQCVVVAGRTAIPAGRLNNRETAAFDLFQFHVGETERSHQLDPAYLKPREVIAVVSHTHLIGFRVPHPQARRKLH